MKLTLHVNARNWQEHADSKSPAGGIDNNWPALPLRAAARLRRLPSATALHAPNAVRPLDETIGSGSRRIPENLGMVGGIDPDQAARDHGSALAATIVMVRGDRGSSAKDAERRGNCNQQESPVPRHGSLPDCMSWRSGR